MTLDTNASKTKATQPARPRNPYVAGGPLGGRAGFFGRHEVLRWVESGLIDPNQNSLILYGQRRIGRTSILLQLERQLPRNRFCPVYFALSDQASRPLGNVLADLADVLGEASALDTVEPAAFDDDGRYFQGVFLPRVYAAMRMDQRPVLLLDDWDALDRSPRKPEPETAAAQVLARYLCRLMLAEPRMGFVITSGRPRVGDFSDEFAAAFDSALSRQVWVLAPDEARDLISQANKDGTLQMDEAAIERVLTLSSGHPYLAQLLCQRIWERANAADNPVVGEAEVEAAINDALQVSFNPLSWIWDGLSPADKVFSATVARRVGEGESISRDQVLEVLSGHAGLLGPDQVELAIEVLVDSHVLEPVGENDYRFSLELLRRWAVKHKPLRAVRRDLQRDDPLADQLFLAGRDSFQRQDWKGAILRFREAIELDTAHLQAYLFLGEALLKRGKIPDAVKTLQAACDLDFAAARPSFARAWLALARDRDKEGDEHGALKAYDLVLRLSSKEPAALEGRHQIWLRRGDAAAEAGDLKGARVAYQEAGALDKIDELEERQRQIWRRRGDAAAEAGDLKGARVAYQEAGALDKIDELEERQRQVMSAEAEALVEAGDPGGALKIYRELARAQQDVDRWDQEIEKVEAEIELAGLYEAGAEAVEAGEWVRAQRLLTYIIAERPTFRDTAALLWRAVEGAREESAPPEEKFAGEGIDATLAAPPDASELVEPPIVEDDADTVIDETVESVLDEAILGDEIDVSWLGEEALDGALDTVPPDVIPAELLETKERPAAVPDREPPDDSAPGPPAAPTVPPAEPALSSAEPLVVAGPVDLALLDALPGQILWKPDGSEMALVPGGPFLLGSEEGKAIEGPVHELALPDFYIDRNPVTNAQFRLFLQAGGYQDETFWTEAGRAWLAVNKVDRPRFWGEKKWAAPNLPVVGVSWFEALAYARWAGKRLPGEAEWEKAAAWDPATGRARRYPWGDKWDAALCNTKEKKGILGIFKERGATPVGSYSPGGDSACGAADMAGNVWEWCSSRWADYPYDPADGREEMEGDMGRVLRGGSWATGTGRVRCAIRVAGPPAESDYFRGFRCVASPQS